MLVILKKCRRKLRRTRRKFADCYLVFLFLKQLQNKTKKKREYSKRIIQFFAVFFVTMACCVARKKLFWYADDPSATGWTEEYLGASAGWAEDPVGITTLPGSVAFRRLAWDVEVKWSEQSLFGCCCCNQGLKAKFMTYFGMLSAGILELQNVSVCVEGFLGPRLWSPYCALERAISLQEGGRGGTFCHNHYLSPSIVDLFVYTVSS